MTKTIDVSTSQTPLAELVSLALAGADVVLTDGERPLFRLVPVDANGQTAADRVNGTAEDANDEHALTMRTSPEEEPHLIEERGFLLLNGVSSSIVDWETLVDRDREARLGGFGTG